MSISNNNRIAGPFIGNNSTNTFPFTFKVFSTADLLVKTTTIASGLTTTGVLGSDYSVALNPNQDTNPGGTFTLLVAGTPTNLATGLSLIATSALSYLQPMVLTNAGGFFPQVLNDSADRAVILIQQLAASIGNSVQAPLTDGNFPMVLPTAALRANGFLSFDSLGNPAVSAGVSSVTVSSAMVPVVGAATLAAARTALTSDAPWALTQGGTGGNSALTARTALGAGLNLLTYAGGSISGSNDGFEFYSASAGAVRKGAVQDILGTTHGLSAKSPFALADEILVQDSGASFGSKKGVISDLLNTPHLLTLKSTPVGADEVLLGDSAASFAGKRATLTSMSSLFGAITKKYIDTAHTPAAATLLTIPHGLGVVPTLITPYITFTTTTAGYTSGVSVKVSSNTMDGSVNRGVAVYWDATNIYVIFGSDASNAFFLLNATSGVATTVPYSSFQFYCNAFA